MNIPHSCPFHLTPVPIDGHHQQTINLHFSGRSIPRFFAACLVLVAGLFTSPAANITLSLSDALGTSSFASAGNWDNFAAPAAGNAYFTGTNVLRIPADTIARTFAGDSLSVDAGGRLLGKTAGITQIITVSNLIMNGGNFEQANNNSDSSVLTWAGNINVDQASGVGAIGDTTNGSSAFETLNLAAFISGSAPLQISGSTINGGQDTGVVELSAPNPYNGVITVSGRVIASAANGLLQLNNLDALGNATLTLNTTVANPVSFNSGVNTGAFKVGALAGTASQTLVDTAGTPVTLSIGGNNSSGTFGGTLSGPGALVKIGGGTMSLNGANIYTGGTTVSGGTLQMGSLSGVFSGGGTVILAAPSAQVAQTVTTGDTQFSGIWVVVGGWLLGAEADAFGTNSIVIDPSYPLNPAPGNSLLAGIALLEPMYDLNSAGALTLTNGGQMVLHQNCAFAAVTIEGVSLSDGVHSFPELAAEFPANFAPGGVGYITVQPYGTLPKPPPQSPQFLTQPVPQTTFTGVTAQLRASVYGYPAPSFQWMAAAAGSGIYSNLSDGGQLFGATTTTLTISNTALANAGKYILVASNSGGSVTSAPAAFAVIAGPAVIGNSNGVTVGISGDGVYTISSSVPAWTFSGTLGQMPVNLIAVGGADNIGSYSELRFGYQAGVGHSAAMRLYTNQPVVLFTDTTLAPGTNDLAFPHLTTYPANLYHLSYSGEFAPPTFSALSPESPWLFFDANFNSFIISPATNYVIASDVQNADGSISCGINPAIPELPAGFTHRALLTIQTGLNQAFVTWGNVLTGLSGKVRPANDATVELNKLGYWTDNGATYYYSFASALGYTGTLLAVKDQFVSAGLPLGYMQLDSWWYPKGTADTWEGDLTNNRGGVNQFVADPTLFPNGLADFQQQLGLPLVTHCRWIDTASPYRSQYAMSQNIIVDPVFWTNVMQYLKASGVITFEQDWLSAKSLPAMNLNDPPAFMNDMSDAAATHGINLQYCMELPRHYLQSSIYNNLVTLRVSIDRFEISKWNSFLYCSRLANAVGAWPWTDVYQSTAGQSVLLGTLSAGPVGVGDALGTINKNNLSQAVRTDGLIVKPDVSLAPVDQVYLDDAQGLNLPMVASTYVDHGNLRALYVFAYARTSTNISASFTPSQLGVSGAAYVYDYFHQTGSVLGDGNPFNFSTSLASNTAGNSFYVTVPIGPSGIAFLGDTNKFVTLGKKRISALSDTGIVKATVLFAAGESSLTVSGYAPSQPYAWAVNGVGPVNYDPVKHLFSLAVAPGASGAATLVLSLSPAPFLQITNVGGNVQISWPATAAGYTLERATTLASGGDWTPVSNQLSVVADSNTVSVLPAGQAVFYRLRQ